MKKLIITLLLLPLLLCGCGQSPDRHPEWGEDWVRLGDIMAVEPPEGFDLGESNDTLSMSGIWYYTWTCGQGRDFVNAEGEDATAYDAQIYLLLKEGRDEQEARDSVDAWITLEGQSYGDGESVQHDTGSESYCVLPHLTYDESNPYSRGAAAFTAHKTLAVSVEVLCGNSFKGDPQSVLEQFLSNIHYGE